MCADAPPGRSRSAGPAHRRGGQRLSQAAAAPRRRRAAAASSGPASERGLHHRQQGERARPEPGVGAAGVRGVGHQARPGAAPRARGPRAAARRTSVTRSASGGAGSQRTQSSPGSDRRRYSPNEGDQPLVAVERGRVGAPHDRPPDGGDRAGHVGREDLAEGGQRVVGLGLAALRPAAAPWSCSVSSGGTSGPMNA